MAWTVEHRRAADRRGLRYPSDLTDAEWVLVAPLIRPAKHGGRPRKVDMREVLNAVFCVRSTGCQWSTLPKDPPKSRVWDHCSRWEWEGTIERIYQTLFVAVRKKAGREASPTMAINDGQTANAAQKGPLRSTRPATTRARKSCCRSAGSSSAPSDGSAATDLWPATSSGTAASPPPWSAWP
jgi:transposase